MKEKTNRSVMTVNSFMTKSVWRPAITGMFFIALGVACLVLHEYVHAIVGYVIGSVSILAGIFMVISSIKNNPDRKIPLFVIFFALVLIVLGVMIILSERFVNVVVIVISIFYFMAGLVELYIAISVSPYLGISGFLINSIISIGLAVAVWVTYDKGKGPDWFLGFILGTKFITYGLTTFLILWLNHSKDRGDDIEVEIEEVDTEEN